MGKRMQKRRDARKQRREEKRKQKFGVNPVTGETLNRKTARMSRKFGFNEDGTVNSRQQNRQQNKGRRLDRKDAKLDNKRLRIEGRNIAKENRTAGRRAKKEGKGQKFSDQGEATVILAEQGIDVQGNKAKAWADFGNNLVETTGDVVGDIFGGGGSEDFESFGMTKEMYEDFANEPKAATTGNNNMLIYIVMAVIAFLGFSKMKK